MVSVILDNLAEGRSTQQIVRDYPPLKIDDVKAAIAYAAELAAEEEIKRLPKFTSLRAQREFWNTHDSIEILGERGWKVSEPGSTYVTPVYVAKVGSRGAVIRVPREWLASIGAKKGRKVKAQLRGKRLVMELA